MVVKRGVNEHAILPMARALPRHAATSCASSSTWTSATRTAGGWTTSCRPPRSSPRSTPSCRSSRSTPNYRGEVARRWRYRDGSGEIGVIASVTQPFCGDCTRARLSAEGQLYTCLFARPRPRPARAPPRRRLRRRARDGDRRGSGRAATTATPSSAPAEHRRPAQGRDVATSAAELQDAPAGWHVRIAHARAGSRSRRHDRSCRRSRRRYLPRGWRDFGLPARDLVRLPRSRTRSPRRGRPQPDAGVRERPRGDRHRGARRRTCSS